LWQSHQLHFVFCPFFLFVFYWCGVATALFFFAPFFAAIGSKVFVFCVEFIGLFLPLLFALYWLVCFVF
jgi:hypothetical protein